MPIVTEHTTSGRASVLNRPSHELVLSVLEVSGVDTPAERAAAVTAALASPLCPVTVDGLPRQDIRAEPLGDAAGSWRVIVTYQSADSSPGGGPIVVDQVETTFSTGGGSARVRTGVESISDTASTAHGGTAPSYGAQINVTDQGTQGIDVIAPRHVERYTKGFAAAAITNAYKRTIAGLTGKTNDATWNGWNAGEALFLGATQTQSDGTGVRVQFEFEIRPDTTVELEGFGSPISVGGHDVIWTRSNASESGTPKRVVQVPESAHVVRVYERGDFGDLDL
jgi:hypothetical protein